MRSLAVLVVLALAPAARADAPVARWKLLVLDVNAPDLEKSQAETLTTFIAARAARFPALDVTSATDIRDMAALEADKQQMGCDQGSTSCLAEIAGAMGADFVLSTHAGKLDGVIVVALQLFDARVASGEGRASVQGWSLAELPDKIGPALDDILEKATGGKPVEVKAPKKAAPDKPALAVNDTLRFGLEVGGGVGAAVGVAGAALGAVPALVYGSKKNELRDGGRTPELFGGRGDFGCGRGGARRAFALAQSSSTGSSFTSGGSALPWKIVRMRISSTSIT